MMKFKIILVVISLFLLGTFAVQISATPQASVSVSNADASLTLGSAVDSSLTNVLSAVPQRVSVQFANSLRHFPLLQPSVQLTSKLDGVRSRVSIQFANSLRRLPLAAPSAPLTDKLNGVRHHISAQFANSLRRQSLNAPQSALANKLNQLPNRVALQFANANRTTSLNFPISLIQDTVQPQAIASPETTTVANNTVEITWMTDEFTTFEIEYGTSSGNYTVTIIGNSYETQHSIEIIQLVTLETYYVSISIIDLSGNRRKLPESKFVVGADTPQSDRFVYLPIITQR